MSNVSQLREKYEQKLTFSHHVTALVEKYARSLCALKTMRAHGLAGNALFDVAQATTVAQLLYASLAWWGFLETHEKNRLQSTVRKAQRSGFLPIHSIAWMS